jgi:hypothetical protein
MKGSPETPGQRFERVLGQIGAFFMGSAPVQNAAVQIAQRLEDMGIDYAIAGALSLAAHGVVRVTEDVDVLLSRDDLERFKETWIGRGYLNVRAGGKAVRDTVNDVKIDFLITGDFPGDGKPKPVAFPIPRDAAEASGRFRVLSVERLVELKLASGLTAPHRLQDLADVQRLIAATHLPRDFAGRLDPYVRPKFEELWLTAQHPEEDY